MINVWIDEMTPCLKDAKTGEIIPTEVIRIVRKSFLSKYNRNNGWYVDWSDLLDSSEVYGLVIKGTVDIQGLIALEKDDSSKAMYITWMVAAPQNNREITDDVKNIGVGGHLFSIAADKSFEYGYEGFLYGFAANEKLLKHYVKVFGAIHVGILHPYHFMMDSVSSQRIREIYDYEWTDAKI
ncbi:MAG: hypothetical protein ACI4SL_03825 [Candidatus Ornithospirochaeta sp.]